MTPLLLFVPLFLAAVVLTTLFGRFMPVREAALGLSMLVTGTALHALTALDRWWVLGLVAGSHAAAWGAIALRVRRFGR